MNRVFDLPKLYSGAEVLAGVYGYAFQLYYDFSGYTDIAIGSALLLGITLPRNFNRPYAAQNISDFWRRWHISFSNWLRDYLYFSLPGLRSRWKIFAYLNLVITMVIGGLWHGAGWTFLVWGAWHGDRPGGPPLVAGIARQSETDAYARSALPVRTGYVPLRSHRLGLLPRVEPLHGARYPLSNLLRHRFLREHHARVHCGADLRGRCALCPKRWYDGGLQLYCRFPYYAQAAAIAAVAVAIRYVAGSGSRAVHLFAILIMPAPSLPKKTSLAIATLGALLLLLETGEISAALYALRGPRFSSARYSERRTAPAHARTRHAGHRLETPPDHRAQSDRSARQSCGRSISRCGAPNWARPAQSRAFCITAILPSLPIPSPPMCARSCSNTSATPATASFSLPNPGPGMDTAASRLKGKAGSSMPPRRSAPAMVSMAWAASASKAALALLRALMLAEDHSQMEIHFLRQPGGGVLSVEAGGQKLGEVETDGPEIQPGYQTFPLSAGAREINLIRGARPGAPVRRQFRKEHAGRGLQ